MSRSDPSFFGRLLGFFRPGPRSTDKPDSAALEPRRMPITPWGKNALTVARMQVGQQLLNERTNAISESLQIQGRRQEDIFERLARMNTVLEKLPAAQDQQEQSLQSLHHELLQHARQQEKIGLILRRLSESGGDQKEYLLELAERVETLHDQDQEMANKFEPIIEALQNISQSSLATTELMRQMGSAIAVRDREMGEALLRQHNRFTVLLWTAIGIAFVSLILVILTRIGR